MPAPGNLVHEVATTTGVGNLTVMLDPNAQGKQRFSEAFGTGGTDVFDYFISNRDAQEWEVGTGHMVDANTLARDTVVENSNGDTSPVSFGTGTKDVTNDITAAGTVYAEAVLTDNAVVRGDATVGAADVQTSGVVISDADNVTGVADLTATGTVNGSTDVQVNGISVVGGLYHVSIPASMFAAADLANPATITTDEGVTVASFDPITSQGVRFSMAMPDSWDEGTITFQAYARDLTGTSNASETAIFTLAGYAVSGDEALPGTGAIGGAQSSTCTRGSSATDLMIGTESAAITIQNTPLKGDMVIFEVYRDVTDTMDGEDVAVYNLKIYMTFEALNDG